VATTTIPARTCGTSSSSGCGCKTLSTLETKSRHEALQFASFAIRARDLVATAENKGLEFLLALQTSIFIDGHFFSPLFVDLLNAGLP
jgi:hypothetical protein